MEDARAQKEHENAKRQAEKERRAEYNKKLKAEKEIKQNEIDDKS